MRPFKLLAVMLILFSSCVKENRRGCPCRLYLDFSEIDRLEVRSVDLQVNEAGSEALILSLSQDLSDAEGGLLLKVPRKKLWLNVYAGDGWDMVSGSGLVIPYGEACPSVYMYSVLLDADCEQLGRKVKLVKNHCRMTVNIEGQEEFPFGLAIRGDVCGYSAEGMPQRGDFRCMLQRDEEGAYPGIVPRQIDNSLMLDVLEEGEKVLKTFALGEYLAACGYDWHSADLSDVLVSIDYMMTRIAIKVKEWEEVYEFDVVI